MIENDLYNYWTTNLSFSNLSKRKEYKVVYNIKAIIIIVLLIPLFVLINLIGLHPLISMAVVYDYKMLVYCAIVIVLIIISLLLGKIRFELRWLTTKHKEDVSEYELRENKLKNRIETRYVNVKKDNTEFYKELIRLCEKKGKYTELNMSFFYTMIGIIFTLCAFVFDGINSISDRLFISSVAIIVISYAVLGSFILKRNNDKPKRTYSNLADALSRILLKNLRQK